MTIVDAHTNNSVIESLIAFFVRYHFGQSPPVTPLSGPDVQEDVRRARCIYMQTDRNILF